MFPSPLSAELAVQHQADLLAMAAARTGRHRPGSLTPDRRRPRLSVFPELVLAAGRRIVVAARADLDRVHLGPVDTRCLTC